MEICKRHLNWTLFLGLVLIESVLYILPTIELLIIVAIASLSLQVWYLYQKKRSFFFVLLSPIILLFLTNKRNMGTLRIWGNGINSKTISTNDSPQDIQGLLSCPSCMFFNKQVEEWCNAPDSPDIREKYCHTFKSTGGKG